MTGTNSNLDLANINAYIKLGETPSICSKYICGNKNLISIKGHNSVTNLGKMTVYNPNLDLVYKISEDIERKQISDINQGP